MTLSPADLEYLRALLAGATRLGAPAPPDPSPVLVSAGFVVHGPNGWRVTLAGVEVHLDALRERRARVPGRANPVEGGRVNSPAPTPLALLAAAVKHPGDRTGALALIRESKRRGGARCSARDRGLAARLVAAGFLTLVEGAKADGPFAATEIARGL